MNNEVVKGEIINSSMGIITTEDEIMQIEKNLSRNKDFKRYLELTKQNKNRYDFYRKQFADMMIKNNLTKVVSDDGSVSVTLVKRSPTPQEDDISLIPKKFKKMQLDKDSVKKEMLRSGGLPEIPGISYKTSAPYAMISLSRPNKIVKIES